MNIFITGINGFIGSQLAKHLHALGHSISGSVSSSSKLNNKSDEVDHLHVLKLDEEFDDSILMETDALFHCAHDFHPGAKGSNIRGTVKISLAAKRRLVPYQLFFSSYSALPHAESVYGQIKFELERYFLRQGYVVVRPGLVIGKGGLFYRITQAVNRFPVLPLPDGGKTRVPIIGINDLLTCLTGILDGKFTGVYNLFNHEEPMLRDILYQIKRANKSGTIFFPVQAMILFFPLFACEKLGIRLPINMENLRGYINNQSIKEASDIHLFLSTETSLEHLVNKCL